MGKRKPSPKTPRPKKERFLQAVALTGNITQAAKIAGCNRHTHKTWMKEDREYPDRFREAMDEAADLLEQEAKRRAVDGTRRLKFQGGEVLVDPNTKKPYVEYEYSDTLLIFLLKGARPEKFRERVDVQGNVKQEKPVGVIYDGDFYNNANRLNAVASASSTSGPDGRGQVQSDRSRPPGGEDGDGADGNGDGAR